MHKPESMLENETRKILRDFKIQTDHLISARRTDLGMVKKMRTSRTVDFAVLVVQRVKIKVSVKRYK